MNFGKFQLYKTKVSFIGTYLTYEFCRTSCKDRVGISIFILFLMKNEIHRNELIGLHNK